MPGLAGVDIVVAGPEGRLPEAQLVKAVAADGLVAEDRVLLPAEEELRFLGRRFLDRRFAPSATQQCPQQLLALADQHQVDRFARFLAALIGAAARQVPDRFLQRLPVVIGDLLVRVEGLEIDPRIVRLEAGHAQEEREVVRLAAAEHVDVEALRAPVGVREHEARLRLPGLDVAGHGEVVESLVHRTARFFRVAAAVHVGHLERREVLRVGADGCVTGHRVARVLDLQPDGLDALVVEVDAEDPLGLVAPGNGRGDVDRSVGLAFGAREEGAGVDGLVQVGSAAAAGQPGSNCQGRENEDGARSNHLLLVAA